MNVFPGGRLEITGHSDNTGSFDFNLRLSVKRAKNVMMYLISKGCSPEHLSAFGKSYSFPVSDNRTRSGRQQNRRVEFRWIETPVVKFEELDANGQLIAVNRTEMKMEFNANDKDSSAITNINEENISAILKWKTDKQDSAKGNIRLIPIDDRKNIAVALTMDYSGSMWDLNDKPNPPKTAKILGIERGVMEFINNMNSNIYAMIIKFGTETEIVERYTNDVSRLRLAVTNHSFNRGWTALYKSIHISLTDTTFSSDPTFMKTIIAFTDGAENRSGAITIDSVIGKANEKGIRVYTIGMLDKVKHSFPPGQQSRDERDLVTIANQTGGFYNYAPDEKNLSGVYKLLINQIKNSYSVSIYWNEEKLPPKGTPVKAVVTLRIKNRIKQITKDYVIQ
jgi:hypothetical protein